MSRTLFDQESVEKTLKRVVNMLINLRLWIDSSRSAETDRVCALYELSFDP